MVDIPLKPTVSIGLPVYNGEKYLANAMELLLNQTYTDFELIISDNASTDTTADICQHFLKNDPRIKYIRQKENIGAAANFEFVLQQAQGDFFMWAAHDDEWSSNYVACLVESLKQHDAIVLAYSSHMGIDAESKQLYLMTESTGLSRFLRTDYHYPNWYNATIFLLRKNCMAFYGMYRINFLKQRNPLFVSLDNSPTDSDVRLLLEAYLHHKVTYTTNCLFKYRILGHSANYYNQDELKSKSSVSYSGISRDTFIFEPLVKYSPLLALVVRGLYTVINFKRRFAKFRY